MRADCPGGGIKMNIPDELAPLFQNYDLQSMDIDHFADLIIRTALTRGSLEQIDLLWRPFPGECRVFGFG